MTKCLFGGTRRRTTGNGPEREPGGTVEDYDGKNKCRYAAKLRCHVFPLIPPFSDLTAQASPDFLPPHLGMAATSRRGTLDCASIPSSLILVLSVDYAGRCWANDDGDEM